MKINIKKILSSLFLLISILTTQSSAYADSNNVFFEIKSNDQIIENRLFNIYVQASANYNIPIGVFSIDISYNPQIIEFKSIASNNDNVKIKYALKSSDTLTIIYLNANGTTISNSSQTLFYMEFKMLSKQPTSLSANVYDMYDINTNPLKVNEINNFYISISQDSINNQNSNLNVSSDSYIDSSVSNSIIKNIDSENKKSDSITMFILGMFVMIVIFIICIISYNIGRNKEKSNIRKGLEDYFKNSKNK